MFLCDDMVCLKPKFGHLLRQMAVFTAKIRPFSDQSSEAVIHTASFNECQRGSSEPWI